jgi:hypothetical protein
VVRCHTDAVFLAFLSFVFLSVHSSNFPQSEVHKYYDVYSVIFMSASEDVNVNSSFIHMAIRDWHATGASTWPLSDQFCCKLNQFPLQNLEGLHIFKTTNTSSELRKPQISYKNVGVTDTQTNVFIYQFTTCSAQTGHHQMVLEENTNGDGLHINSNASIKLLLVKIGWDPT